MSSNKSNVSVGYNLNETLIVGAVFLVVAISVRLAFDYVVDPTNSTRSLVGSCIGITFGSILGWKKKPSGSEKLPMLQIIAYSAISQVTFTAISLLIMFV